MRLDLSSYRLPLSLLCALCVFLVNSPAEDACVSGLKVGQRPGPYSFLVATGAERGQQTCYVCETAERPAVIVFARNLSDPLGKLVAAIDKAVGEHKKAELRAWVTFLSSDQSALDPQVVEWGKKFAIRSVPLGVFESEVGPPSYKLARDAEVTVLLFVNRKVAANFAFRSGELNDERTTEILKSLPRIVKEK
jgi:hypothetical protein